MMFSRVKDERIEENYEKIGNILFLIMFLGSIFIHFMTVAYNQSLNLIMYNFTSILFLIGIIIFVYQLRKRQVYFHSKFINKNKINYLNIILKRILIFSLIFLINIIPFLVFEANLLIGLSAIGISIISISLTYLLFSLYEKNHYDESEMLAEGKTRNLSKNVVLFYTIPFLYGLVSIILKLINNHYLINENINENFVTFSTYKSMFDLYQLDIIIFTTITLFLIRNSIKKWMGKNNIYKLLTFYIFSSLILSTLKFFYSISLPYIIYVFFSNDSDQLINFINKSAYFDIGFVLFFLIIKIIILYHLYKRRIIDLYLLAIFIVFPPISILFSMWGFSQDSILLIIISGILSIIAAISLYIFFIKQTQLIKTLNNQPDYT